MMAQARLNFRDGDGYCRNLTLEVPAEVDTETLEALLAEIDPNATLEYTTSA